jgi:hypothetical protein
MSPLSHPYITLILTCLILPPFTLIPLPFTLIPPCPYRPYLPQAQEHSDLSQSLPLSLSSSVWVRASERMDALQVGLTLRVHRLGSFPIFIDSIFLPFPLRRLLISDLHFLFDPPSVTPPFPCS